MDLPASVMGLTAMRLGTGIAALTTPSLFALVFGRPVSEATSPMATMASSFFGIRELGLVAATVGASAAEPRARRRILLVGAATDGLDLVVLGIRAIREPALRRPVMMFAPASIISVALHLRAARQVEVAR